MLASRLSLVLVFAAALLTNDVCAAPAAKPTKAAPAKTAEAKPVGDGYAIAAVVGEQAISELDVNNRVKFILATTKLSNTPDVLARIRPQVVAALINESLQLQEANADSITVTDPEIATAIANIEQQRQMPAGGIADMLATNNIPPKTFNDQIRAQLAWNKIIAKKIRPRVKISDEELVLAKQHINPSAPGATQEVQISVITLPVEKKSEADVKKAADKLSGELQKGAQFEEVARQFSVGASVEPFWVNPKQLDPALADALAKITAGGITAPVRTETGFNIVKLLNVRAAAAEKTAPDSEVNLKEILLKLKPTATQKDADVLLEISHAVAKNPGTCEDKTIASISDLDLFDIEVDFNKIKLSELPIALQSIVGDLKVGAISSPYASDEGVRLYMLCSKKDVDTTQEDDDKIREILYRQKMELEMQKYLRDLRNNTFVEIRGDK